MPLIQQACVFVSLRYGLRASQFHPIGGIIGREREFPPSCAILGYLSLALYAASFACYARILYVPNAWLGRAASVLLAGGLLFQYYDLLERSRLMHTVPYDDLYGSMSLFAWLFGITYLVLEIFHRQRTVGALVTLLLLGWVGMLALGRAGASRRPRLRRAARCLPARDAEHVGLCGVCAIVCVEPGLSGAGSLCCVRGG